MITVNGNGNLVKKNPTLTTRNTIPSIFDFSLHEKLGFSLFDLSYQPSLEETVSSVLNPKGESTDDQMRFTVNHSPELVSSTIYHLRGKHEKIPTQAAAQRILTRQGIIILQRISGLKEIIRKRKLIYEYGDEMDRLQLQSFSRYELGYHLSLTKVRQTVYTFRWVGSKIVEMASDLVLPQEIIVIQTLIGGMATSGKWIPSRHWKVMFDEMIRFATWVDELSEKL
jgi:hypothetical protein